MLSNRTAVGRIDNAVHAVLAVAAGGAVKDERIGGADGDAESCELDG